MPNALARDPSGRLVPFGRVSRRVRADFLDGNNLGAGTQSWLTAPSGTVTYNGGAGFTDGGQWACKLSTAASANATAKLTTTFGIKASACRAIRFTVEGLAFDTANTGTMSANIGIFASGYGARLAELETSPIYTDGSASNGSTLYSYATGWVPALRPVPIRSVPGRRNLTLLLLPPQDRLIVMRDDQEILNDSLAASTGGSYGGLVYPTIDITTKDSAAHFFSISAAEVEVITN